MSNLSLLESSRMHGVRERNVIEAPLTYQRTQDLPIPVYLEQTYWWAYLHPKGVRFFERQWLVNVILWGNFARLRDAALREVDLQPPGRILQVACVYGDFTQQLLQRVVPQGGQVNVMDVAPVQLDNLCGKLDNSDGLVLHHQDSTQMTFTDGLFDTVLVFFLLHEQPAEARIHTVAEAFRVVRPGGKVIFVDYHGPHWLNPLRYLMFGILAALEPFAMDLWKTEIKDLIPSDVPYTSYQQELFFGGLYQKVVVVRS